MAGNHRKPQRGSLPYRFQRACSSADTLIHVSGLQNGEKINFCCFKPSNLRGFVRQTWNTTTPSRCPRNLPGGRGQSGELLGGYAPASLPGTVRTFSVGPWRRPLLCFLRRFYLNVDVSTRISHKYSPTPQKMSSNFSSFLHLRSVSSSPALNLTSFHKQHPLWFPRF